MEMFDEYEPQRNTGQIYGVAEIGKSSSMREYVRDHERMLANRHDPIQYLQLSPGEKADQSLLNLAELLKEFDDGNA